MDDQRRLEDAFLEPQVEVAVRHRMGGGRRRDEQEHQEPEAVHRAGKLPDPLECRQAKSTFSPAGLTDRRESACPMAIAIIGGGVAC
jgi:hypothetical protein